MDPQQMKEHIQSWLLDRQESDDEIDEILGIHIQLLSDAAADEDELSAILNRKHGGSWIGRSPNLHRDHAASHNRIMEDYFVENPKYPDHLFRKRFRMRKELFLRIHDQLLGSCRFFVQRPDVIGNPGLCSIQKMTAAIRMFTYGMAVDAVDEYVQIGESTTIASFKEFADGIVNNFEDEYMRAPTEADVKRHMDYNFLGCLVSWIVRIGSGRIVPTPCKDNTETRMVITLSFYKQSVLPTYGFGMLSLEFSGSNNDVNVVDRSPLLVNMLNEIAPAVSFNVNGHNYPMFYLLTDGIYPDYTIFVKTISNPDGAKRKYFAKRQEGVRKDIERCFGVLQVRFAMVQNPSRWWQEDQMITVWKAAIIMHNMIIEDEEVHPELNQDYLFELPASVHINRGRPQTLLNYTRLTNALGHIRNRETVTQLQEDLVAHLWEIRGNENED